MTESLISDIATRLKTVRGVEAIVIGGSYATGSQRTDSDIDLGIYYAGNVLDIPHIKTIASQINDSPNPVVTDLGGWGKWVNGGAWLTVRGQRVDFLYRDIDFVSQVIDDCLQGRTQSDYYQQPPYGFHSYMYCAETEVCKILYDPAGVVANLKAKVSTYPTALQQSIVQGFMWQAEFSLVHAKKAAERSQVFIVAGCVTRIASCLVQTLYALNKTFFLGEKRFYQDEPAFAIKPADFRARLEQLLGGIGETRDDLLRSVARTEGLFEEFRALCGGLYTPRY